PQSPTTVPFVVNTTAPTETSTLSLHDALPIYQAEFRQLSLYALRLRLRLVDLVDGHDDGHIGRFRVVDRFFRLRHDAVIRSHDPDRKSTRLNSSHEWISYAVFFLKKKYITYLI